jgi:hypothetical protein
MATPILPIQVFKNRSVVFPMSLARSPSLSARIGLEENSLRVHLSNLTWKLK